MKILLLNASYPPNLSFGAERVVQTLAEGLVARGHQVTLVTTQPTGDMVVSERGGVRVYYVPVVNVYRPFAGEQPGPLRKALWHTIDSYNSLMANRVLRIIESETPDVVNSHNLAGLSAAVLPGIASRSIPVVHTLHDQYLVCSKGTMFSGGRNCQVQCRACHILARPRRWGSRNVDVVVGVSQFILKRHLQYGYFPRAHTCVIHNAFDAEVVSGESPVPAGNRPFRFGYMGQLRSTKGLHKLVAAFARECGAEAELWIAGKGDDDYEAAIRTDYAAEPGIRWLGHVRPQELLENIDVLVVPSLWNDTAPLVLLEAFASGIPVAGASRGGIPEFVDSASGWLFDPDDMEQFRRVLRTCLESRSTLPSMAKAVRGYSSKFGVNRFLDQYLEAYGFAAAGPGNAHADNKVV